MEQERNTDQSSILDYVMRFIFIVGDKGKYKVSINPEDCSIRISVPGRLLIKDNIRTIQDRKELYRSFDSSFYYQIDELLSKYEYRKMVIRLESRK